MFDPTIFDNLKIVLEGAVYDRDLDRQWTILDREDLVDLSRMSRTFRIQFCKRDYPGVVTKMTLSSDVRDFAAEWLTPIQGARPGAYLEVCFTLSIRDVQECEDLQRRLLNIWRGRPLIQQHLTFAYPNRSEYLQTEILLHFERKIDETHIDDMQAMLDHIAVSLDDLNARKS